MYYLPAKINAFCQYTSSVVTMKTYRDKFTDYVQEITITHLQNSYEVCVCACVCL